MIERSNIKVTRQLGFKAQLLLLLAVLLVLTALRTAQAEGNNLITTTTTTTTTVTNAGPATTASSPAAPTPPQDFIVTARFGQSGASQGLTGCKTEQLAKDLVRDLKSDCGAWLKDRRAELNGGGKSKYQTGTCQEECADCGMGLQRCAVVGTVHYRP